ncbi:MAG: efflux RND transporter periplasmic adaptor subunit [Thermoguttaceae bacterium]
MGKRALWGLVVWAWVFGIGCQKDHPGASDFQDLAGPQPAAPAGVVRLPDSVQELVEIKVEPAKYRKCPTLLKAMGKILAPRPQTAIVSHAFPARVAEIRVEVGDWVKKGQELVILESKDVGEAKADFYKALASHELAKNNLAREERLLHEGVGVKKNFVAAEAEYKVAQANLEVAHKKLHILGFTEVEVNQIAQTHQINPAITLCAPIEGKIVEIKAVRGAMVDPATQLLTIIDPRSLWIEAELYEKDIAKIRIGQEVEIRVPAYPERVFHGRVGYIGDVVNPETRTITVRTELANDAQLLKPGMFADVDIVLDEGHRALVVPLAAILEEGDQKFVFVKQKDHFVRREVRTGSVFQKCQQVTGGLVPGELVVVEGNHQLKSKLQEDVLKAAGVH